MTDEIFQKDKIMEKAKRIATILEENDTTFADDMIIVVSLFESVISSAVNNGTDLSQEEKLELIDTSIAEVKRVLYHEVVYSE